MQNEIVSITEKAVYVGGELMWYRELYGPSTAVRPGRAERLVSGSSYVETDTGKVAIYDHIHDVWRYF